MASPPLISLAAPSATSALATPFHTALGVLCHGVMQRRRVLRVVGVDAVAWERGKQRGEQRRVVQRDRERHVLGREEGAGGKGARELAGVVAVDGPCQDVFRVLRHRVVELVEEHRVEVFGDIEVELGGEGEEIGGGEGGGETGGGRLAERWIGPSRGRRVEGRPARGRLVGIEGGPSRGRMAGRRGEGRPSGWRMAGRRAEGSPARGRMIGVDTGGKTDGVRGGAIEDGEKEGAGDSGKVGDVV
ncbi:uncharacterized protein H6S33_007006 [Morchella sextelata]|uniref:uncharacterized protein n=1 Tax=Morchella sextelata TaxID=1174677 RepID=UPI001D04BCEF|nr:uncharacterized protein H6S33_007006 [Morchella sextelata]KAH0603975.1 hypothetical protein H6S33_007006 [Morchella sextelata]